MGGRILEKILPSKKWVGRKVVDGTPPKFNSSPLKNEGLEVYFPFGARPIFRGELLNFRGVSCWKKTPHVFKSLANAFRSQDSKTAVRLFFLGGIYLPDFTCVSDGDNHPSSWAFHIADLELTSSETRSRCHFFHRFGTPLGSILKRRVCVATFCVAEVRPN